MKDYYLYYKKLTTDNLVNYSYISPLAELLT